MALALVLSLGACDEYLQTESSIDDSESDDTSLPSETVTLTNYTVEFDFGETIPSYAKGYIIGSWDSWTSWLALEETNNQTYTYTFASIDEGSYTYKGVMFYVDDESAPSWEATNAEFLTDNGKDATLVVSSEDEGYQLITHTLENVLVELKDDNETINAILEAASQYEYGDDLKWSAYYFTDGEDSYYLTQDENDATYGVWLGEDTHYIKGGTQYVYDESKSGSEAYTTATWSESYTYPLEDRFPFEPFERLSSYGTDFSLDDFEVEIITSGTSYILILTETTTLGEVDTYIYIADSAFSLTGVGFYSEDDEDTDYFITYEISYNDVENALADFDTKYWSAIYWGATPTSANELVEKACYENEYEVCIYYDAWKSTETLTYSQYIANPSDAESYLYGTLPNSATEEYYLYIDYTQDYVYASTWDVTVTTQYSEEILANDSDGNLYDYYSDNLSTYTCTVYENTTWQESRYNLVKAFDKGICETFSYAGEKSTGSGLQTTFIPYYLFNSNSYIDGYSAQSYFLTSLGLDFIYGESALNHATNFIFDGSWYPFSFDATEQQIDSGNYYSSFVTWDDDEPTDNTQVYYLWEDIEAWIYYVGDVYSAYPEHCAGIHQANKPA